MGLSTIPNLGSVPRPIGEEPLGAFRNFNIGPLSKGSNAFVRIVRDAVGNYVKQIHEANSRQRTIIACPPNSPLPPEAAFLQEMKNGWFVVLIALSLAHNS